MSEQQNTQHFLVNAHGYMFAVAVAIGLDLEGLEAQGVTVAKDESDMLAIAAGITEEPAEELNGCHYVITKTDDVLMIADMRGVNVPLEADDLADYIIKYEM